MNDHLELLSSKAQTEHRELFLELMEDMFVAMQEAIH